MNSFSPEKNFKSERNLEEIESNDSEYSKLANELEFNSTLPSAEQDLVNRENLFKLSQDSKFIKKEPVKKEPESKSKIQEEMDKVRESIRNLLD